MSLNLAEMRASFRKRCGDVDTDDMSNAAVDLLLNQSYWEILDEFHFREKELVSEITFTDGVRLYDAPTPFEAVQKISMASPLATDNKHLPLLRMDIDQYEREYDSDDDAEGKPTHYVRYNSQFYLWPTPDATYDGFVYYWTTLADLSDSNDQPGIPQVWHEIILHGGVARGWLDLNDTTKATYYFNLQMLKKSSIKPTAAKEEDDSQLAGIDIPSELFEI